MEKEDVLTVLGYVAYHKPLPPDLMARADLIDEMLREGLIRRDGTAFGLHKFTSKVNGRKASIVYSMWRMSTHLPDEAKRAQRFLTRRGLHMWDYVDGRKSPSGEIEIVLRDRRIFTYDFVVYTDVFPDGRVSGGYGMKI